MYEPDLGAEPDSLFALQHIELWSFAFDKAHALAKHVKVRGPELGRFAVDAVRLDWTIELEFARSMIQKQHPVQGNVDPLALLAGGAAMDRSIVILAAFSQGPFIMPRINSFDEAIGWI